MVVAWGVKWGPACCCATEAERLATPSSRLLFSSSPGQSGPAMLGPQTGADAVHGEAVRGIFASHLSSHRDRHQQILRAWSVSRQVGQSNGKYNSSILFHSCLSKPSYLLSRNMDRPHAAERRIHDTGFSTVHVPTGIPILAEYCCLPPPLPVSSGLDLA